MNQKEISELRRRWRPDKNAVSHIYGCFVDSTKRIIADLNESLGMMPEEEAEKYLGLLKKTLSGQLGKNLIDIVFSTRQVMDGEEHHLLMDLRKSALQDGETRRSFYQKVVDSLDMGESSYLLLMACDAYDVKARGRDGMDNDDASDEVFTYYLCAVCPVKDGKAELVYYPGDNEFHYAAERVVSPPELGFLFPAFDDRTANIYNALFYSRKPGELHQEFIDAVFHTDPPMSAVEQKEAFQTALSESLEDSYSMEVAQAVHERLTDKLTQHKESRAAEPLTMTVREVSGILADCGVEEERLQAFQDKCVEQFGQGAVLTPANLIDPGHFQVKTSQAALSIDPECSYSVETREINGKQYILIPAEEGMEVNGMAVKLTKGAGNAPE